MPKFSPGQTAVYRTRHGRDVEATVLSGPFEHVGGQAYMLEYYDPDIRGVLPVLEYEDCLNPVDSEQTTKTG